ncbi:hypothetical protein LZ32DRAFT_600138 [Colletotrichum eremochloae]|nr:hypothetical protein LZ32DRAFT_600138 [Colletotrichum eremochloae]
MRIGLSPASESNSLPGRFLLKRHRRHRRRCQYRTKTYARPPTSSPVCQLVLVTLSELVEEELHVIHVLFGVGPSTMAVSGAYDPQRSSPESFFSAAGVMCCQCFPAGLCFKRRRTWRPKSGQGMALIGCRACGMAYRRKLLVCVVRVVPGPSTNAEMQCQRFGKYRSRERKLTMRQSASLGVA